MKPYYETGTITLHLGDCREVLAGLADGSADAIVTDPPYELGFMGRAWDASGIAYDVGMWAQCLRVLKPGGHLLAFGGSRTYHRMVCAVEDAGFEIRDKLDWIYGSGFPKSLDVGKAIDKAAGAEREVVGLVPPSVGGGRSTARDGWRRPWMDDEDARDKTREITAPATDEAARWDGWGTALKPAHEPIVLARKPLSATVAATVLEHGTGAINIAACRVPGAADNARANKGGYLGYRRMDRPYTGEAGRWPTNILLGHGPDCGDGGDCQPGCPVAEMDRQSGRLRSGANPTRRSADKFRDAYGDFKGQEACTPARGADEGGASRFFPAFRYEAKAGPSERPRLPDGTAHTTVKPLALMRWLVRLVTPPGGIVLDPFAGSGTTGEACAVEGFRAVLIEADPAHAELIKVRLSKPIQPTLEAP